MRTMDEAVAYCLSLEGAFMRRPFGPGTLVATVKETKGFCYIGEDSEPLHIIVKCDPMEAELLRAAYESIKPGYHFNKKHWNSIYLDGSVPDALIRRMIDNSYALVMGKKRNDRNAGAPPQTPPRG